MHRSEETTPHDRNRQWNTYVPCLSFSLYLRSHHVLRRRSFFHLIGKWSCPPLGNRIWRSGYIGRCQLTKCAWHWPPLVLSRIQRTLTLAPVTTDYKDRQDRGNGCSWNMIRDHKLRRGLSGRCLDDIGSNDQQEKGSEHPTEECTRSWDEAGRKRESSEKVVKIAVSERQDLETKMPRTPWNETWKKHKTE